MSASILHAQRPAEIVAERVTVTAEPPVLASCTAAEIFLDRDPVLEQRRIARFMRSASSG